jgi:NAD(P)-dependent dehydrogenase (short-subunit alcohol dehydrogenase family)
MTNYVPSRYEGRTAVVTGGASGIGEAIVRRLCAEGATVVAGDVDAGRLERLAAEFGGRVAGAVCDVRSEGDVEALIALAVDRFGRLDAGFNVAGVGAGGLIVDLPEERWDTTVDVCLKGVYLAMKHEARRFLAQQSTGAIVNVSSVNAKMAMFGGAPYCAAKAGVVMLSECGALEWGEVGIRVNTVSPGLTATPLTAALISVPGAKQAFLDQIPINKLAHPEDMASAALYLASDDASYVTGANLTVDGGFSTTTYPDLRPLFEELTIESR